MNGDDSGDVDPPDGRDDRAVAIDRVRDRVARLAPGFGETWIDDEPWRFLTELTALGSRMAGSEGERRAAELVVDAFERAGLREVRTDPFELTAWERGESTLQVTTPRRGTTPSRGTAPSRGTTEDDDAGLNRDSDRDPDPDRDRVHDTGPDRDDGAARTREFESLALPYSPAGTVAGELVDVGHGTPAEIDDADVDGRIAVASTTTPAGSRFVHRMETFGHALDAGAVGFVFANHLDGQLPPTGALTFGDIADTVAVGVSMETGAWLREYATNASGPTADVELSVDARTRPAESRNVIGRTGPDTDERLLLLAHYDGHDIAEGALDNGCGIATAVAAAGILAEADLPIGVDVVAVGCEEVGLLGSERLAATTDLDRVRGVVNVDGAGRFRDLRALTHTSEAAESVVDAVSAATRHPIEVKSEPHPFSDQWPFVRQGVPALQLHSDSGERGRGWGHTHADTRDKVDDRNVREHAMLAALLVTEFAAPTRDPPRLDVDTLAGAFRDADFEAGMRAAGLWPDDWS